MKGVRLLMALQTFGARPGFRSFVQGGLCRLWRHAREAEHGGAVASHEEWLAPRRRLHGSFPYLEKYVLMNDVIKINTHALVCGIYTDGTCRNKSHNSLSICFVACLEGVSALYRIMTVISFYSLFAGKCEWRTNNKIFGLCVQVRLLYVGAERSNV